MPITNTAKNNNSPLGQFIRVEPNAFGLLKAGDLIEGAILSKSTKLITVDLGKHGLGGIYRNEMQNARELIRNLKIGDVIQAKVIEVDNEDDLTELSLAEAGKQKSWTAVQELFEKEEIIEVEAAGANRGGIVAEIEGLPAFLPISQLTNEHYPKVVSTEDKNQIIEALQKLVGQKLRVKIIDVNPRTNKFIVSERAAVELDIKELAKNYEVGQVVEGIISGVADFGAFVRFADNPAVEGLIHISELSWRIIDNPKEVVRLDQSVKAKISEIKDGKISLSLKALATDPWQSVPSKYQAGEIISGAVYSFNPFGVIINLDDEIQGQLHVTEFGSVEKMKEELIAGQTYDFVIESVNPDERRITLKVKR